MGETPPEQFFAVEDIQHLLEADEPPEDIAASAIELGRERLGVPHGHIARIVPELNHWEAVVSTEDEASLVPSGTTAEYHATYCRHAVEKEETFALDSASDRGYTDDRAYQNYEWECYISTPLYIDETLYGTLCFVDEGARSNSFSPGEIAFVECLSQIIQQKLSNSEYKFKISNMNKLIGILSRVLRHNLRNNMSVVRGYAEMLVEQVEDPNIDSDTFLSNIERTISLAEKSIVLRRIADSEFQVQEIALASVVEEQAAKVRAEFPDATFHIDSDNQAKITTALHLDIAIRELLENAIKHSPSGTCDVQIESTVDDVSLTVSDDGPGLPDHEQSVLSGIPETALRHSQGLGLWIVNWAVSAAGGSITPAVSDAGTEISVTIPRLNADNALTME